VSVAALAPEQGAEDVTDTAQPCATGLLRRGAPRNDNLVRKSVETLDES